MNQRNPQGGNLSQKGFGGGVDGKGEVAKHRKKKSINCEGKAGVREGLERNSNPKGDGRETLWPQNKKNQNGGPGHSFASPGTKNVESQTKGRMTGGMPEN